MRSCFPFSPNQDHNPSIEPAQAFQPLLAVGFTGVFVGQQRHIKNRFAFRKIDRVFAKVFLPLGFVTRARAGAWRDRLPAGMKWSKWIHWKQDL